MIKEELANYLVQREAKEWHSENHWLESAIKLNMYIKRLLLFPTHKCFVCYKYIISNTDETFHNQLLLEMPENGIQVKGLHQGGGTGREVQ